MGLNGKMLKKLSYFQVQLLSSLEINNLPTSIDNIKLRALVDRVGFGCTIYSDESTILVNPLPIITIPSALEECDDDFDGIVSYFDLESKTEEIRNNQSGISVTLRNSRAS